jgi:hypothetical protein
MRVLHRLGRAIHRAGRLVRDSIPCKGRCCGDGCSLVYFYGACPPPNIAVGSQDVPPECNVTFPNIYVCSDAVCNGTPIRDLLRIIVNGRCYSRPEGSEPFSVPADDPDTIVYDSADISCTTAWTDCADPVCVDAYGRRFVQASPCPGQNYQGPPIYFLACAVRACDVVNVAVPSFPGGGTGGGVCVFVGPGAGSRESDLPPDALKFASLIDGRYGGKCCACLINCSANPRDVTGCNGTGPATTTTLQCCCSVARTVTGTVNSFAQYDSTLGSLVSRSVVGSGTWQYDESNTLYNQIGGALTITEKYSNGPDVVQTFPMTPWAGCGIDGVPSAFPFGLPFGGVEQCNPSSYSDVGNIVGGVTNRLVTCRNAQLGGSWSLTRRSDGLVLIRANSSSVWAVTYTGQCSGQCGGSVADTKADRKVRRLEDGPLSSAQLAGCSGCADNATGGIVI